MITEEISFKWTKEFSYFLGYLWSDGFVERKRIGIQIIKNDALNIINDIQKIDFLNICTYNRSPKNRQPQMVIYFCNVKFYDGFISKYYINKSENAPVTLLQNIPNELKRYFYLGLIDGDGCFYISKNFITKQFYITSSYTQDWSHIENLFKELNITKYEIRQTEEKNGNKSSYIRIKKYDEIKALYDYLYPDKYEIGLNRKYNKCKLIIEHKPKQLNNTNKIDQIDLLNKINYRCPVKVRT